jgi:mono/diheme cytochrome c family protein
MTRLLLLCALASLPACRDTAPHPQGVLTVEMGASRASLTSSDLLEHTANRKITLSNSPVYPDRSFEFSVVPMSDLISPDQVPEGMHLLFECEDGFATSILASRVLSRRAGGSRAFLAVEEPEHPWPPVHNKPQVRPGPFFLVWVDPGADHVVAEEWPYQIRKISVAPAPGSSFERLNPAPGIAADSPVRRGHDLYMRHCLPCHTLNGEGRAAVGPDLNLPMSPAEYFKDGILRRYVRDPRSVRAWPGQRMPAFSKEDLDDEGLAALEQYLRHMADRRAPSSP